MLDSLLSLPRALYSSLSTQVGFPSHPVLISLTCSCDWETWDRLIWPVSSALSHVTRLALKCVCSEPDSGGIFCRVQLLQWMHPEPDGRHGDLSSIASLLMQQIHLPEPAYISFIYTTNLCELIQHNVCILFWGDQSLFRGVICVSKGLQLPLQTLTPQMSLVVL